MTSPASLRARWRGDSNTNEDTGAYNGVAAGGIGYTTGRYGMAFAFDGVNDAVTADARDELWPAGSFSIEVWVKMTVLKPQVVSTPLFQKYDCGGTDACGAASWAVLVNATGNPVFDMRVVGKATANITASSSSIVDGAWHHLVAVRDVAAKQIMLYVDGKVAVTATVGDEFLGPMTDDGMPDPVTIGSSRIVASSALAFDFVGAIDEPAYYISALGPVEIAAIYAAPNGICR